MKYRAVFLDRDGTVNEEVNYLNNVDQLKLIDGTAEAVQLLNNMGFKVIIFTNQAAIARGFLSEDGLQVIHQEMKKMLAAQNARIDAIYYCPHHPTAGEGIYKKECECRKPNPGMLLQAAEDLDIDLSASFTVGDKMSDLAAGKAVHCKNILVRTGYGTETETEIPNYSFQPDYIADNLLEAAKWILKHHQGRPGNATAIG